jgi:maltose phosphorylase
MNIVYGFGGMRSDGDKLSFEPSIPQAWNSYSFRIHYKGDVLLIEIGREEASFHMLHGSEIEILIYGKPVTLGKEKVTVAIPKR